MSSNKCIICKKKRCNFGLPNDKVAKYCTSCKLDNMVNINSSKCIICKEKYPTFGLPNDKIAKYCTLCKLNNMIDIKNPKCIVCKEKQPIFGLPDDKVAKYCTSCKLNNMIDIKNPKCIVCKEKQPVFGLPNDKVAKYCASCKLDNMIDIINKKCKSEWCDTRITDKYNGYCAYCFMHIFPDKSISRNYKTKEKSVADFIKQHFYNIDIITDKTIHNGCSRRRPDIFIDLGYQIIIIEIDENQHIDYDCSCENKRIMQLSQDVNHRPIIFIRFNPDDYNINDKNITSCWSVNKQGICKIKKSKEKEWNERLNMLKENVEYWIQEEHKTNKTIEIIQLYYDI